MSYFSEVEMELSEERGSKHTNIVSGPSYGSQGYIITYELTNKGGDIKDIEIFVKGDLFDASIQARSFLDNSNIDNIYVWDKKTGVVIESVSDMARMMKEVEA